MSSKSLLSISQLTTSGVVAWVTFFAGLDCRLLLGLIFSLVHERKLKLIRLVVIVNNSGFIMVLLVGLEPVVSGTGVDFDWDAVGEF